MIGLPALLEWANERDEHEFACRIKHNILIVRMIDHREPLVARQFSMIGTDAIDHPAKVAEEVRACATLIRDARRFNEGKR